MRETNKLDAVLIFAGVLLVIGWAIYLRATVRSLGIIGIILAVAFFGSVTWLLVQSQILSLENITILTYVLLVMLSAVLATGISWSHIRRRMTGQADVDEVDGDL